MTLEVDNVIIGKGSEGEPILDNSFVCHARDLRDCCKMFIEDWERYENTGEPWAFFCMHKTFMLMEHNMSHMDFLAYMRKFNFAPNPLMKK